MERSTPSRPTSADGATVGVAPMSLIVTVSPRRQSSTDLKRHYVFGSGDWHQLRIPSGQPLFQDAARSCGVSGWRHFGPYSGCPTAIENGSDERRCSASHMAGNQAVAQEGTPDEGSNGDHGQRRRGRKVVTGGEARWFDEFAGSDRAATACGGGNDRGEPRISPRPGSGPRWSRWFDVGHCSVGNPDLDGGGSIVHLERGIHLIVVRRSVHRGCRYRGPACHRRTRFVQRR